MEEYLDEEYPKDEYSDEEYPEYQGYPDEGYSELEEEYSEYSERFLKERITTLEQAHELITSLAKQLQASHWAYLEKLAQCDRLEEFLEKMIEVLNKMPRSMRGTQLPPPGVKRTVCNSCTMELWERVIPSQPRITNEKHSS